MTLDDTATANGFVAYTCEAVARCLVRHADTLADTGGDPRRALELRHHAEALREIAGHHRTQCRDIQQPDHFDIARHVDHIADKLAHGFASGEVATLVPVLRMVIHAMGFDESQARASEVPF